MARYLIQEYNRDMTELRNQTDFQAPDDVDALAKAYNVAHDAEIVVLMRRNDSNYHLLRKIAKFYGL